MDDIVFIQRARLGRTLFALRPDGVEITSTAPGQTASSHFGYNQLASEYTLTAQIAWPLVATFALVSAGCFRLAYILTFGPWIPDGLKTSVAMAPGIFGISFLVGAIRFTRRIEVFTFQTVRGRPAFSIVREREQHAECDGFVHALLDRIEGIAVPPVTSTRPRESAVRLLGSEEDEAAETPKREHRWKWATAAGVIAFIVGALFWANPYFEPLVMPAQVVSISAALLMALSSFQAREQQRNWALVGVALALGSFLLPDPY